MPDSQPLTGIQTAQVRGDVINARDPQGWKALQLSLSQLKRGEAFRFKAVVYRNDHAKNRNGWAIRPGHMRAFARSARGKPLLLNHDENQVVGAILGSKAVKSSPKLDHPDMIVQELEVRTEKGKNRLAAGGIPEFSIRLQRDHDTAVACSICGGDKLDLSSECSHWRGIRYEGDTAGDIYSSGTQAESSIVVGPAVPDTGPIAHDTDEDDLFLAHQMRISRLLSEAKSQENPMLTGDENAPKKDEEEKDAPEDAPEDNDGDADEPEAPVEQEKQEDTPEDGDGDGEAAPAESEEAQMPFDEDEDEDEDEDDEAQDEDEDEEEEEDDMAADDDASVGGALRTVLAQTNLAMADLQSRQQAMEAELEQAQARAAEANAENASLKEHLERIRGEQLADESLRVVRQLRLEGRVVGNESAIVEARIRNPELFDEIIGFVKPNPGFSSIQVARASAVEPQSSEVLSAAMIAHQARLKGTEMAKATGRPVKDCIEEAWANLRNQQHAVQIAARKSRHS